MTPQTTTSDEELAADFSPDELRRWRAIAAAARDAYRALADLRIGDKILAGAVLQSLIAIEEKGHVEANSPERANQ
jgi:hypothetical protein